MDFNMPTRRSRSDQFGRFLLFSILGLLTIGIAAHLATNLSAAPAITAIVQDEVEAADEGTTAEESAARETVGDIADAVDETVEDATEAVDDAVDVAGATADSAVDAAKETAESAEDAAVGFADKVNEKMKPVDKWFKKKLVTPMFNFFFFDFFTGPRFSKGIEFTDTNGNKVQDEGEPVIAGKEVTVEDIYGDEQKVTTDAEGKWEIKHSDGWLGVSLPFVVIWLLIGAIYLTLRMMFINIRGFFHAIRLTMGAYDNPNDVGEVSHFQALASALSATVGLGNIAGVAIAIGTGGPGATFWMILIGVLGMSSKFTECTLGQMYRDIDPKTGKVSGGPMRYLNKGLAEMGLKPLGMILAFIFAILCIGASLGGGNAFQVGQSLDAVREDIGFLDKYPWIYGLTMAVAVGFVIVGGIKSIGKVASRIVPFMCAAYVLMAMYIILTNLDKVTPALQCIWDNAFNMQAGLGAILGVMVVGIQRAVFSNEAGVGSAAIAHSAAKTDEPVSEGIVALLEPFIDTVVICTMTALVIIIAGGEWTAQEDPNSLLHADYGSWENEEYGKYVSGENKSGAAMTRVALSGEAMIDGEKVQFGLPWFKYVLYAAVMLFAYSTLISWYYYGERCWTSLFGEWSSIAFKILFLTFTVLGSIVTTGAILDFSDLLILSMALPNMLGLFLLSGKVKRALDDYLERKRSGEIKPYSKKLDNKMK